MNQDISSSDPRSSYSQSERLIQIGTYLQQVREDQGLSIEQVATKTMIAARHIRAIEAGTMNVLPEAVYVRGFIKRYAEVLGLDGTEISTAFPLATDEPAFKPTWQNSDVAQLRQTHLYLAYVTLNTLAVIGLGAVLVRLDNGDRPGDPA
ncbi:MAG: helix-turn-helix domain-containing protein, partial [Leptolyngbyaceae bacterium]|nr:helix-turn-helix domain-containing protein [Leptolyngbyaceae bacterium]